MSRAKADDETTFTRLQVQLRALEPITRAHTGTQPKFNRSYSGIHSSSYQGCGKEKGSKSQALGIGYSRPKTQGSRHQLVYPPR